MVKSIKDPRVKRHNARWTQEELDTLLQMILDGKTTAEVAKALGRTKGSVWSQKYLLQLGPEIRLSNSRNSNVAMPSRLGTNVRNKKAQAKGHNTTSQRGPGRPPGSKNKNTQGSLEEVIAQAKALGMKVTITLS